MLLQRSKLAATTIERPRLAPPWLIALLGAMVLAVLVGIYPHQTLIKRILEAPAGEITEAYLTNLLRTDPKNPKLRIMLARNQLATGLFERVAQTLAPALESNEPLLQQEAAWLLWQSEEIQYLRLPTDSPKRPSARQRLRLKLAQTAEQQWPEEVLGELARKAISFGDMPLGRRLFERLAATGQMKSDFWYAEAAHVAMEHSEYRAAAEFFLIARGRAHGVANQRRYFLDAMHALESGNRVAEALAVAEDELRNAPDLIDDPETLIVLIGFARAAHRPDLADKYARRLLRLSLLERWRREQQLASGFDASPRHVALSGDEIGKEAEKGPQLPFDDRIYTLGFESFVDNRKLDDAWKVAASAVRQAPANLLWRERLAKVSEWTVRPAIGLENWLYLARATNRDDAWQAVLRLAPGLLDDDALRSALHYQLGKQPKDEKLLRELTATYERLGDPQGGLRFLEQTYKRTRQPLILEQMAELAERAGDPALALRYWKRFLAEAELTPARAVRVATLMLLHDQPDQGLALLQQAQNSAGGADIAFWRLTAELAELAQKDEMALGAYRQIVGNSASDSEAEAKDYEALYRLMQDDYPLEAAQVAATAWRRFHQPPQLVQALGYYASHEGWREMGRLLGELDADQLLSLRRQPDFLQLFAQYHLNTGQPALARRDLETARQLSPQAPDIQLALLWLHIDSGNGVALRHALSTWEGGWRDNPALHDALGSAYLALSLPDIALRRYYTPRLAEHRDDFLWLMNYADALEQNQETERAWQLRHYLLTQERQRAVRQTWLTALGTTESLALRRVARARLTIAQRPGETGFAVLRELLRLDRDVEKNLSAAAKDVALGWLQEASQYQAERGWLWQQYARTAARPLWAEITLALTENDRETAGQLLERHGERLPRYDRIAAARLSDDVRLAQSDAFDTQTSQHADDPLHQQLADALLAHSDSLGGEFVSREVGTVGEREIAARWHLAISPRLRLDLAQGRIPRVNHDTTVIGITPDESYHSARLAWRHPDGETQVIAENRKSLETYQPLRIEHEQRIDDRLSVSLAMGIEQQATESLALRVAGMKNLAQLGLRYRPTLRDQIRIERQFDRYAAQTGTDLGSGQVWQFEVAHALRIEPRDLEASLFWSDHRYDRRTDITDQALRPLLPTGITAAADLGADFFLPSNFRYYGIRLSTDTRFEREYTRAWRPYATLAKTWHDELGPGYDLSAGIAGSLFGADHLNFGWKLGKGGTSSAGLVREIGLTYRVHY
jgi:hypothetical protein